MYKHWITDIPHLLNGLGTGAQPKVNTVEKWYLIFFSLQMQNSHCEDEPPSPISGYAGQRLARPPQRTPAYYFGPCIREYWGESYWAQVRRGGPPGRALTYGSGIRAYPPLGPVPVLPWKQRKGSPERGV